MPDVGSLPAWTGTQWVVRTAALQVGVYDSLCCPRQFCTTHVHVLLTPLPLLLSRADFVSQCSNFSITEPGNGTAMINYTISEAGTYHLQIMIGPSQAS
jgi:hypothetical protein